MSLETILVAVSGEADRTKSVAQTAVDVAGPAGATVRLLHVFSEEGYETVKDQLELDPDAEVTPGDVAARHATIREVGSLLDDAGVEYEAHGAVGETSEKVLELAEEADADMVVVGGRGRSAAGKTVFGSTAQKILSNAPCPVTYVRAP
ncbi:universal stress protein [Halolamina sp. CBA1230]|uniref:universal stress protein n=1 Tax=Halolamina sp. CBA1230 TaxID=1853690 RepID=UPI0009A1C4BD|nr:universal stress protein [Halolamina sp. CBA1230]QKY21472.1 universal stress protein [Halolamina sp. CBA1230]